MSPIKIKDLFHFEKGSLQSTKATPGDYNFITAAADWKTHNEFTHDCEALIFAAAASGSLGRTHYVNGKFISSDLCFIITPKDPDKYPIDLKFYHLIFEAFKDEIVRNTKSGTSKESIGLTVFGKYELPYFEIDKQVETREKFVDAQKSTNKIDSEFSHQLDLLTQLRQAYLREAMQGDLVPQDLKGENASMLLEKIRAKKASLIKEKKIKNPKPIPPISEDELPFEIPENWTWCQFYEICEIQSNLVNPDDYLDYPHIAPNNIEKNTGRLLTYSTVREDELISAKHLFYPEQLLYSKVRPKLNKVVKVDFTGLCSADMYPLKPYISSDFLLWCMLSDFFINEVDKFDNRVKMPKINQKQLSQIPIPLPPLPEQKRIVAKLNELIHSIDELELSIQETQHQNELLLKQILTEALGLKIKKVKSQNTVSKKEVRTSKFDPNTTLMEIVELLKKHGKLHAEELWKMSKYPDDIDAFYAELKKQIELNKVVKESNEKGYLELV